MKNCTENSIIQTLSRVIDELKKALEETLIKINEEELKIKIRKKLSAK